jgi:hypothetical protein
MSDNKEIDKDDFKDTIDIPVHQQTFTFTYIIGEDKDNGTTTTNT